MLRGMGTFHLICLSLMYCSKNTRTTANMFLTYLNIAIVLALDIGTNLSKSCLLVWDLSLKCLSCVKSAHCPHSILQVPAMIMQETSIFKASALWADAFYKSKCPYVCLCVCSLLRYRLNVLLSPLPKVGCPTFLEIRNPWGKVMERSGLR